MAVHSVPQDVEADDKLFLFLSLKQFIFVVIGLGFGYLAFFFFTKVHPLSALLWIPVSLVFLVLGLYQRKDQPAEVFLASAIGFYLKPHVRIWSQDGYEERVHITAPPVVEKKYTKDFTGEEASGRLANLSLMMDSRGWASKQVSDWQNPNMATVAADSDRILDIHDVASGQQRIDPFQYSQPADPYDDRSMVGKQFETKIEIADATTHQTALKVMEQAHGESSQLDSAGVVPPPAAPAPVATAPAQAPPADNVEQQSAPSQVSIPSITDFDGAANDVSVAPVSIPVTSEEPDTTATEEASAGRNNTRELNVAHENEDGSVELKLH